MNVRIYRLVAEALYILLNNIWSEEKVPNEWLHEISIQLLQKNKLK